MDTLHLAEAEIRLKVLVRAAGPWQQVHRPGVLRDRQRATAVVRERLWIADHRSEVATVEIALPSVEPTYADGSPWAEGHLTLLALAVIVDDRE